VGRGALAQPPPTAFYDWLYLRALARLDAATLQQLRERDGFTDIAFNPERSLNCQARSAALYVALAADGFGSPWALGFESFVATAYAPGA
jgi:hypothetical protein